MIHHTNPPAFPAPRGYRAFSLVEVALAVAIVGVSLLSVVGLMPSLMDSERGTGANSMAPRLRSLAMGELRARTYPATLPHTEEILFTDSGEVTSEKGLALYRCRAVLTEIPRPPEESAGSGGIPDVGTDSCLATLSFTVVNEPSRPALVVHESLAREK